VHWTGGAREEGGKGNVAWEKTTEKNICFFVSPFLKKSNSCMDSFHRYSLSSCSVPKLSWEYRKDSDIHPHPLVTGAE